MIWMILPWLCLLFSQEVFDIFQNELGGVNLVEAPRREVMVSSEDWTCSGLNLNFLCLGPKRIICDQVHCVVEFFYTYEKI